LLAPVAAHCIGFELMSNVTEHELMLSIFSAVDNIISSSIHYTDGPYIDGYAYCADGLCTDRDYEICG
jgi:hypothetical protein